MDKRIERLKYRLEMHRRMANWNMEKAKEMEKKLEELGVIVPTAADPLCQRKPT